ncbi:MAG TPA: alpha/beta family hydrolase [Kofleriaceae bacterium]|nr:alpha/beta family hydrolase [Kofleriaceae bacterium]
MEVAIDRPRGARAMLVLAHGAGAGMRHAFMNELAAALAARAIATLRYQFPYMQAGRPRPDRAPVLEATVRAAVTEAARRAPDLALFAGGKSMGGRMTSQAQAEAPLPGVRGIVFFGFPLHPAGAPATTRAEHLARVRVPMLFLQGTRDELAGLDLLAPIVLAIPHAFLEVVDDADHSFRLPAAEARVRSAIGELAGAAAQWMASLA